MSGRTLSVLVRREARDAFSDWRTFLPTIVLTLFLPLLIRAAALYVIAFVDDPLLPAKLIPFGLLLVGFVPISFSMIPALETFVGERERNSLESLLSAPATDQELYAGKFLAGLLPPLISGTLAMTTFTLSIWASSRDVLQQALPIDMVLFMLAMVLIKALTMVSASVLVSSKTTSVRSASLLASFIIIPMSVLIQIEALLLIGEPPRHDIVASIGAVLLLLMLALTTWGMRSFSREGVLSREHRQLFGEREVRQRRASAAPPPPPLVTLFRREVRDTFTDWRIMVPVLLLALLLPLLIAFAFNYAANQMAEASPLRTLVPFGLVMVGFLPASFSLITALESFVGEKERGSLESLFSMPLADWEIYLGKLLASLTTPLASGLLAMVIFASTMIGFGNPLLAEPITGTIFLVSAALVIIIALVMVSGAVVISSHTSTVRVANLLASFILLPTSISLQLMALLYIANRWDVLGLSGLALLTISFILINAGMQSFNREEILARDHSGLAVREIWDTFKAFMRQYGPPTMPPEARTEPFSLRRAYRVEVPAMLRDLRFSIALMVAGAVASSVVGALFDQDHNSRIMTMLVPVQNIGNLDQLPPPGLELVIRIFVQNMTSFLTSGLISALSFGVFAMLVPTLAFLSVGHGAYWAATHGIKMGAMGFLLGYVLPHGIIELPAAIIGAAAGMRLGLCAATVPTTISVGRHILWGLALYLRVLFLILAPMLLISALIEGLITPLVTNWIF